MRQSLQRLVMLQAQARPERIAVIDETGRLTYGQLEQAANRLANMLQERGCRPGDRVVLALYKSADAIAGMIGTLKAGCAYVPIDVTSPASRTRKILGRCEPAVILGERRTAGLVSELVAGVDKPPAVGWLDVDDAPQEGPNGFTRADLLAASDGPPELVAPSNLAHILFTSGSTGEPKGVAITHDNVLQFVEWANGYFGLTAGDRVSGHSPYFFDLSTYDVYGAFHAGAELHLVAPGMNLLPHKLAAFIRERELTQWFSVPSILSYLAHFDVVKQGDFPTLKRILWCGEVFPTPQLRYWMQKLPEVQFTNLYGPTEATIASSYYTMPGCPATDREEVPIGQACAGEELVVLDEALRPVAPGQVGELCIGGAGLSPGYWGDPARTAEVFVDRAEGRIYRTGDLARIDEQGLAYYLGRKDSQIKSRGFRIELGEIDTALHALTADLREAAVVALPTEGFEGHVICCAYVPAREEITPVVIRSSLRDLLPPYMIPTRWRAYEALPKTPNGKTDRRRLREEFAEQ